MTVLQFISYVATLVGGWIMVYFLAPLLTQRFALKKDLLVNYLVPFKNWCPNVYKELTEFKERYTSVEVFDIVSKTLVIIDYRELHDVLRDSGKYRCKIGRKNPKVAMYLKELESLVDNLWHSLQDDFSVNFDQSDHDEWISAIIKYKKKDELVNMIKKNTQKIIDYLKNEENFNEVINYLVNQIPRW